MKSSQKQSDETPINEPVNEYIEYIPKRVTAQRKWYEAKATENKRKFLKYQTLIIVLGAFIPVWVAFESIIPMLKDIGGPVTALISAFIAILAGLDKLNQPQPNWFNYRANEEALKKEEWFYLYGAGPYKNIKPITAKKMFVERIESVISADIARFTNGQEEKKDPDSATQDNDRGGMTHTVPMATMKPITD